MGVTAHPRVEWAVASRPCDGEHVSGDAAVVVPAGDAVLFAVIDALGHGPRAAETAEAAVAVLRGFAGEDVAAAIEGCHDGLLGTRGAAVSAVRYSSSAQSLTWAGIGNVEALLVRGAGVSPRPTDALPLQAGVVGGGIPEVRVARLPVERGDVLLLATDGVDPRFADRPEASGPPQQLADRLLARHGRETDDALVLAARLLGRDR
jgi:negative regulator of sigma-B (phosphoserine phosphatase)